MEVNYTRKFKVHLVKFLTLLIAFTASSGKAQILFINPSIENPGCANCNNCAAPGWTNCALTPDVQPGEWGVNTPAQNGCNYAGFCDGEYIGQQLNCTLVQGKTYSFTLWLAYDNDYCSVIALGTCGDPGSRGAPGNLEIWAGNAACAQNQMLWQSGVLTGATDTWVQYTVTFTPNANYDFVLFKNDVPNSNVLVDNISSVLPIPNTINVNQNVACNGDSTGSATITASGSPSFDFTWSDGFVETGVLSSTHSNMPAGTYTVVITDPNDTCAGPMTATVTITEPAAMVITTTSVQPTCNSSNGSASVSVSGGQSPYTYAWSTGATTSAVNGLAANAYNVVITDATGCSKTENINLNNSNGPQLTLTSANVACNGGCTGTASANITGGAAPYTYQWSNGQSTSAVNALCAGNYSVVVTDNSGCTAVQTLQITQPSALAVTTTVTSANCGYPNGSATATVSGGTPGYSYLWSNGSSNATATGLQAIQYTVTVTDSKGCSQTQTAVVPAGSGPALNISQVNVSCFGQCTGNASVTASGGTGAYTYAWSNLAVASSATGLCAGTYSVLVSDATGCTATSSVVITQPASAVAATVTTTPSSCTANNGSATVTASGGTGNYTYLWTPSGQNSSTATGLGASTYTVLVMDANGCSVSQAAAVSSVNGMTSSVSSTSVTCNGGNTGSATASTSGGNAPYSYVWSNSQQGATANNLVAGTYSVLITDASGCTSVQTVQIAQPAPIIVTISSANENCGKGDGSAMASASGINTYQWSNGQQGPPAYNLSAGTYSVVVTDTKGCTQVATAVIGNNPGPTAVVGPNVTIAIGATANLTASGGVLYSWSPSAGLSCTNCPNPVASPSQTTQYCVTVTDSNGCTGTACMNVTLEAPCPENMTLDLPNAFSPNNDGHNDVFLISGLDHCVEKYTLTIYNRWGEKVYESSDLQQSWDGIYHGRNLDPAVFVYYFSAVFTNGQSTSKKGNISLIR